MLAVRTFRYCVFEFVCGKFTRSTASRTEPCLVAGKRKSCRESIFFIFFCLATCCFVSGFFGSSLTCAVMQCDLNITVFAVWTAASSESASTQIYYGGRMRISVCCYVCDLFLHMRFCVAQYFSYTHSTTAVSIKMHKATDWANTNRLNCTRDRGAALTSLFLFIPAPAFVGVVHRLDQRAFGKACGVSGSCLILISFSNWSQLSAFAVVKVQNAQFHAIFTSLTFFFSSRWIYGFQLYSCKI